MDAHRKPRHIRDIAHLYLSRLPARRDEKTTPFWVVAVSRECFSAYHAANLALGLSREGHAVELVEVSGVLPCAAYFLRLPPRVYMKHKAQSPREPLSALGGITVRFAVENESEVRDATPAGVAVGSTPRRFGRVEVVHLPPVCELESLQSALAQAQERAENGEIRALVLAPTDSQAYDAGRRILAGRPGVCWSTLSLERRITTVERSGGDGRNLGYLVGWRQLLADPIPCVLRDPASHVSRSYLSICEAVMREGKIEKEQHASKPPRRAASLGPIR
jgi:hypothetical protein